jgi:(4-O-methyl)-D-glucuronate---lignin esterase
VANTPTPEWRVGLNGHDLGILWKRPFVKYVSRIWPNRLIGDQHPPAGKRFTWTNITKFRADSPLLPSGLLGPVVVHAG